MEVTPVPKELQPTPSDESLSKGAQNAKKELTDEEKYIKQVESDYHMQQEDDTIEEEFEIEW